MAASARLRLDNIRLNGKLRCKAVFFDLQALRIEPGERVVPRAAVPRPAPRLAADTAHLLLTHDLRDEARQRGVDHIGPRHIVLERLVEHLKAKAEAAAPEPLREKYQGRLDAARARAALNTGPNPSGGWAVQPGATELMQYLDNRGIQRVLMHRPSVVPGSAVAADQARELLEQMATPPFAVEAQACSRASMDECCAALGVAHSAVLMVASCPRIISQARDLRMLTCHLRKKSAPAAGRVPDYCISAVRDLVGCLEDVNGVSFRAVPRD